MLRGECFKIGVCKEAHRHDDDEIPNGFDDLEGRAGLVPCSFIYCAKHDIRDCKCGGGENVGIGIECGDAFLGRRSDKQLLRKIGNSV